MMKRMAVLSLSAILAVSLAAAPLLSLASTADAASSKEWLKISERVVYYGEVKDGQPHGKGTIKWGNGKQYSGDFFKGKRTGSGKYMNEYVSDGEKHKVVYNGSWQDDRMEGKGTMTHKVSTGDGTVRWNQIQSGTYKRDKFQDGYDVIHISGDPDYKFYYRNGGERLTVMGSNEDMRTAWTKGRMFSAEYRNGSVHKSYSIFPESTKAGERKRAESLRYLQSLKEKVSPILVRFEQLSKQVPLK
ncbi:hypothetical protein [Paenibacillus dakarensis]|uniref:hypothetical protein n=1 Tax=Paenibacillus dakarensis TaxID=1527293 RepID=UPI0006D55660|nr:hypothetical protein [Paenibacillus dakarensis]